MNYPLTALLSDGLDVSGSHKVYNQVQNHPDLSTKSFLLFAFKVLQFKDPLGNTLWTNPCPNSLSHRPIALLALGESEDNVKLLMKSTVNPQTRSLKFNGMERLLWTSQGVCLTQKCQLFLMDQAASCHLCTSTRDQLKDIDIIKKGFPINRSIESAFQIFEDVDEDEFLSLPSKDRFGITHKPLSDENILSASPLHGYLRVFGWLMQLVYHLLSGEERWTPSSSKIHQKNTESMPHS